MTEAVPAELAEALIPVMRDLSLTSALVPRIEAEDSAGNDSQVAAIVVARWKRVRYLGPRWRGPREADR